MKATEFKKGNKQKQKSVTDIKFEEGVGIKSVDPAPEISNVTEQLSKDTNITEEVSTAAQEKDSEALDEYSEDRIKEYYEEIKDYGITDENLISILDTLVTSGQVTWSFKLFDKIDVEMVMRPAWVNSFVLGQIESLAPKTYSRFVNLLSLYNLAGSLRKYGKEVYLNRDEDDIIENYEKISNLGFIILNKLTYHLAIFDRTLAVATSDWAIENFTQPQSED